MNPCEKRAGTASGSHSGSSCVNSLNPRYRRWCDPDVNNPCSHATSQSVSTAPGTSTARLIRPSHTPCTLGWTYDDSMRASRTVSTRSRRNTAAQSFALTPPWGTHSHRSLTFCGR